MKHQLCRNCGHRHALGAPCVFREDEKSGPEASPPNTDAAPAATSSPDSPAASSASSAGSRGNADVQKPRTRNVQSAGTSTSGGPTTNEEGAARRLATGPENQSDRKVSGSTPPPSAMTPAQKQKAYRERDPDRKREMDRLRKRKKRDG